MKTVSRKYVMFVKEKYVTLVNVMHNEYGIASLVQHGIFNCSTA